uniref:Uncharacterized protein n=1 Tax=Picea sitchensis TaxID=3332 RepID=B8LRV5_PICSI|nr:unknown [Picea sitchensis]
MGFAEFRTSSLRFGEPYDIACRYLKKKYNISTKRDGYINLC